MANIEMESSNSNAEKAPKTVSEKKYEAIVNKLAFAAITEQRRARRWRIFFLILFFTYITVVAVALYQSDTTGMALGKSGEKHTALVKMPGVIASGEKAGAENIIAGLKAAFENKNTAGIVLEINSPGGSPVQSAHIFDEIQRLRAKYESIPIYAVVTDVAASGGYFVAAAADKIFVNKSSLVGSIGVRMDSFGFVGLMEKVGVERRLLVAGDNKGLLDPFLPENQNQKDHLEAMLGEVHQHFIDAVRTGRGDRLTKSPDLFSGLIWTGEKAIELGLVDDYGTTSSVARVIIAAETVVDFTPKSELFDQIAERIGASISNQLALWMNSSVSMR